MRVPQIGDVYYLDLTPVTSHSPHLMRGHHMVLIVQTPALNNSPLRTCVPMTSAKPEKHFKPDGSLEYTTHYLLRKEHYSFLRADTIVKCEQIITIEWKKYLKNAKYVGRLDKGTMQDIIMKIATAVGMKDVFSRKKL